MTSMFALTSCEKDEPTAENVPPQPLLPYSNITVGSGLDTLPLLSAGNLLGSGGLNLPLETYYQFTGYWQSQWTCTEKPAGAPDPIIHGNTSPSARAVGLRAGSYRFDITYATAAGSKKSTMEVTVVPDKPAGTVVTLNNLPWYFSPEGGIGGEIPPYATSRFISPDLFYFRGKGKEPAVEYLDPVSNQWIKASIFRDYPALHTAMVEFNEWNNVLFDYTEGSMQIRLIGDFGPIVRLTY